MAESEVPSSHAEAHHISTKREPKEAAETFRQGASAVASELLRLYVAIDVGLIAGSSTLLAAGSPSVLSAAMLGLGILLTASSIGAIVIHMQFHSKRLFLFAEHAERAGDDDFLEDDSARILRRADGFHSNAQKSYALAVKHMSYGTIVTGLGFSIHYWSVVVGIWWTWLTYLVAIVILLSAFGVGFRLGHRKGAKESCPAT